MIKESNERLQITMSKKQRKWLLEFCKNHDITPSKYICWMLSKKAEEMLLLLKINEDNFETREDLMQIIKTNWIND